MLTVVPDEFDGRDDRADAAAAGPIAGSSSLIDEIGRVEMLERAQEARRLLGERDRIG